MGDIQKQPLIGTKDEFSLKHTYNTWTGWALCVNMIIGTGVFNLPYAFGSSGLILASVVLFVCAIFAWFCLIWFLEVCARAEGVTKINESDNDVGRAPHHQITFRKFDLTSMMEIFFGLPGKIFAQLFLALYCYGLLWAYAAVFAGSIASLFFQFVYDEPCNLSQDPSAACHNCYLICLVIYAVIVVPLACMNLSEQAEIQVALTCYRFSAFVVMFATLGTGLAYPVNPFAKNPNNHVAFDDLAIWSGFVNIFSTAAVALNFHFAVPDIVAPLRDKKYVRRMTSSALAVATLFYILLGLLCSMYFGSTVNPLSTLNWSNYTGLEGGWGGNVKSRPSWAIFVQFWVMLFPVFDMLSVFPMIGGVLGENLLQFVPDLNIFKCKGEKISKFSARRGRRMTQILCKLIATIPPIIMAGILGKLDKIIDFTGLSSFFLELIFPCLLQFQSVRYCTQRWGPKSWITEYTIHFSHKAYVAVTFVFGVGALVFAIYSFAVSK